MRRPRAAGSLRRGLTLIELLIATSVVSMSALALGVLSRAVQISSNYTEGQSSAAQHARVVLDRIQTTVLAATANETFPGVVLFAETVSSVRFPDTIVVWKPETVAANPTGLPLFSEIVVYCPNPSIPTQLLEITNRSDTRTVPALTNTAQWATELTSLKTGAASKKVILTDLLRSSRTSSNGAQRGCVRFEVELHPTAAEIAAFRAGTTAWSDLPWPQHWYGETTGMRQTWLRSEMLLFPNSSTSTTTNAALAIPFFGSAALYYEITR